MKTNSIISLIANIHNQANKLIIEELKNKNLEGLAPSHGDILILLYNNEDGILMNKIASTIHKDKSTVTALVNKLEKLGFVEKFKSDFDSRSTIVKISKKGLELKPIFFENISRKLLDTSYNNFTQEEKNTLFKLLEKVLKNFMEKSSVKEM